MNEFSEFREVVEIDPSVPQTPIAQYDALRKQKKEHNWVNWLEDQETGIDIDFARQELARLDSEGLSLIESHPEIQDALDARKSAQEAPVDDGWGTHPTDLSRK